ncbi:MAG TPA: hypothetical protein VE439_02065 [Anaerolineae bacterium]|jgi:hypothetical protein|nr:hypothetical protein [Anaerolineae bacterium]
MEQNERQVGILGNLPTWREARWWIIVGAAYGPLSLYIILVWPVTREALHNVAPRLVFWLIILSPAGWTLLLLSIVWPGSPGRSEALVPALFLSAALGGLAGYVLRAILKAVIRR